MAREEGFLAMEPGERNGHSGRADATAPIKRRCTGGNMKSITLITRRPDLTRAQFRRYYEDCHAPLGARYFPFEKYVRNHVVSSRPEDAGFDCLMECWLDRDLAMKTLTGAIDDLFAEDEARFMVTRGIGIGVIEHLIFGPERGVDPRGTSKIALFVANAGSQERAEFLALLGAWGRSLATEHAAIRATIDEVMPGHLSAAFTADAVLTLWMADGATLVDPAPPAGLAIQAILALGSEETAPAELSAAFGG
jgi:hypothetical protein